MVPTMVWRRARIFERGGEMFDRCGVEKIFAEAEHVERVGNAEPEGLPGRHRAG